MKKKRNKVDQSVKFLSFYLINFNLYLIKLIKMHETTCLGMRDNKNVAAWL